MCAGDGQTGIGYPDHRGYLRGARTAAEATHNGKIGVIGTEATIRSGIYTREMQKLRPDIEVIGNRVRSLCRWWRKDSSMIR